LIPEAHNYPTPVLEIEWARQDALSFPLCISSIGQAPDCEYISKVSVARGNLILVDQGLTLDGQDLDVVQTASVPQGCDCENYPAEIALEAAPFNPHLKQSPLIFSEPVLWDAPTASLLSQDASRAVPNVWLTSQVDSVQAALTWHAVPDLLGCGPDDPAFVVETDDDRVAWLRFGDGDLGLQPPANAAFTARYRIAQSDSKEFPTESIIHVTALPVASTAGITSPQNAPIDVKAVLANISQVTNPLAAGTGLDPQSLREAKLLAPWTFTQVIQRAITGDDYARIAERELGKWIQRATGNLVWTGSWYEADVALDPLGRESATDALLDRGQNMLERYRRVGHDVRVTPAAYVPLDLALCIVVEPDYLRGHVEAALLDLFSNRVLPGGKFGLFYPDNLTFGQDIYVSQLVAAAQAVAGVLSARVTRLQRLFELPNGELAQGYLSLGPLEIAQLDNDPNYPEHGKLTLDVKGGR
jgi:hypothetical protein